MKPFLELETKQGALLMDEDPVSVLFPPNCTTTEEITARVLKYDSHSLLERYNEACQDTKSGKS